MQGERFKKILEIVVVIIFFSAFVLSLAKPVADPDVFWHLKTGEWIWQNRSLPDKDPFSFTVAPYQYETSAWTSFILKQYWLAQLMLYGLYSIAGFYGIIIFRCLVYLGIGLILYYWMRKEGMGRLTTLIFLMPSVYFATFWIGERPNNLSFLFAVVVVYLLEDLRKIKAKAEVESKENLNLNLFLFPLIMLLWANMHGGFILGDAIIILYMLAEGLKAVYSNVKAKVESKGNLNLNLNLFLFVCLVSILISFVNPNTYKVIPTILEFEEKYSSIFITEMWSPFKYAENGEYQFLIIIGAVALIFFMEIKKHKFNSILLISFLIFLTLTRVRYIPFLIFIATPFISRSGWDLRRGFRVFLDKIAKRVEVMIIFIFVAFLISSEIESTVFKSPLIDPYYPEATVKFIKAERPDPGIFNYYNYGGYLIWSLFPDYKVFIDGRVLYLPMHLTYRKAMAGSLSGINGIPEWKAILDAYSVKAVIVPASDSRAAGFVRLVKRLIDDREWSLVYEDKEALLFIKDTENNREIIRKYARQKESAYGVALERAEIYRAGHPKDWRAYVTLGEINLYLKRPGAAILYLESSQKLIPSLKIAVLSQLIQEVKAGRDYSQLLDEVYR